MLRFIKRLIARYGQDNIADKAAALSYYTIFSIGPLLFLIFGLIGELLKNGSYKARLLDQMQGLMGPQAGSLIKDVLNSQTLSSKTGAAFLIGGVGVVLGAIGIFGQLQKALDDILHVKPGPDAGRKPLIKQKLLSLGLVGVICFLLLVSLIASALISAVTAHLHQDAATGLLFRAVDLIVSLLVFTVLLSLLYRTLPEVRLPWKVLFKTSLVVSIFFSIGKTLLGLIIGHNASISAFGAAGSLIALLLWIFYSGQVIYLGAVGISVYAENHPLEMTPKYKGARGVLMIKKVEEPLPASTFRNVVRTKFVKGFKKGWRKNE